MERGVLVVGESLVDIVQTQSGHLHEYAGGSAANVAVALARLGRPTRLATCFAARPPRRAGRRPPGARRRRRWPATRARWRTRRPREATIGTSGAAEYTFDIDWRLLPLDPRRGPAGRAHLLARGGAAARVPTTCSPCCGRLRERSTITYDVNARPAVTGTGPDVVERVERMVAVADLVKASDEDLEALYPDRPYAESAAALLELGPAVVVVTRGAEGALWLDRDGAGRGRVPRRCEVADTIGAGDTFGAGLVDALWERGRLGAEGRAALAALPRAEVAEVLEHAARAAAVTVSRPGADPPYRHEL